MKFRTATATVLSLAVFSDQTPQALAQSEGQIALEEIVVTARKREENLWEAPLSITSLSSADLEAAQIRDIGELMRFTPGFDYKQQATQTGARINPSFRFRGLNTGNNGALEQLGAVFIDGLYLLGGAQSITMEDVERVEVIKGPQNAFFGRSTFGGAVNFITKEPGDEFGGRASANFETRDTRNLSLSLDGPITDWLSFRISGSSNQFGAHYKATDGGDLGRQRTDVINAQLIARPTDELKIKVRYTTLWDDDSQQHIVDFNPSRADIEGNPAECLTGLLPYWCGKLPKLGDTGVPTTVLDLPTTLISPALARSQNPTILQDILAINTANPQVTNGLPLQDRLPKLDEMGLARRLERISLQLDYEFDNGMVFDAAFADTTSRVLAMNAPRPQGNSFSVVPGILEDTNFEVRLTSPQDQRLTWMVGGNYFEQKELGQQRSGLQISSSFFSGAVNYSEPTFYGFQVAVKYWSIFGSIHYDITDQLSLDVEARYQDDEVTTAFDTTAEAAASFDDFAPRVILTYKPMDGTTVYGSWSRGVLPGFSNSSVNLLSPELRAVVEADPAFAADGPAETLDSYELGIKQQFDRFRYALTGYYMKWNNLKNQVFLLCPGRVCGPGFFAPFVGYITSRDATIKGIEAEVNTVITDNWDATLTFEVVDSKYKEFFSTFAFTATGTTDATGATVFEYPVASGALSSTYTMPLGPTWDGFLRGDLTYTGKTYVDEVNQSWLGDWFSLNLRAGIEKDNTRIEVYVNNVFNQDQWISGRRGSSFNSQTFTLEPTAFVLPARKRAAGVRGTFSF